MSRAKINLQKAHKCPSLAVGVLLGLYVIRAATPPQNPPGANYDERQVGSYRLPDPLVSLDGRRVDSPETFLNKRRPELIRLFETNQYGRSPEKPARAELDVLDKGTPALDGKALRRQVAVYFAKDVARPKMDIALYIPAEARTPAPLLLSLNFSGNSVMIDDPGLKKGEVWSQEGKRIPADQGFKVRYLPVRDILAHGFALAVIYYGDIEPDSPGGLNMASAVCC